MNTLLELLKAWGPLGAFVVALIDGAGLPNPGGPDYLLLYLGWTQPETAYLSAILCLAGSVAGNFILFWLARKGGERFLEKRLQGPRALKFRAWFNHYGLVTLFIPSVVPLFPLPMKAFVLCAGALGVSPLAFVATVAAGRVPRYLAMAYAGRSLSVDPKTWASAHKWHFALVALGLLVVCTLLIVVTDRLRGRGGDKLGGGHADQAE
jgi:membrane protein YqaA with SNARE-associated domain